MFCDKNVDLSFWKRHMCLRKSHFRLSEGYLCLKKGILRSINQICASQNVLCLASWIPGCNTLWQPDAKSAFHLLYFQQVSQFLDKIFLVCPCFYKVFISKLACIESMFLQPSKISQSNNRCTDKVWVAKLCLSFLFIRPAKSQQFPQAAIK